MDKVCDILGLTKSDSSYDVVNKIFSYCVLYGGDTAGIFSDDIFVGHLPQRKCYIFVPDSDQELFYQIVEGLYANMRCRNAFQFFRSTLPDRVFIKTDPFVDREVVIILSSIELDTLAYFLRCYEEADGTTKGCTSERLTIVGGGKPNVIIGVSNTKHELSPDFRIVENPIYYLPSTTMTFDGTGGEDIRIEAGTGLSYAKSSYVNEVRRINFEPTQIDFTSDDIYNHSPTMVGTSIKECPDMRFRIVSDLTSKKRKIDDVYVVEEPTKFQKGFYEPYQSDDSLDSDIENDSLYSEESETESETVAESYSYEWVPFSGTDSDSDRTDETDQFNDLLDCADRNLYDKAGRTGEFVYKAHLIKKGYGEMVIEQVEQIFEAFRPDYTKISMTLEEFFEEYLK